MADEFDAKWEEFEAKCRACSNCGLRSGATNVVISRGGRHAPLMIIGEAPGEQEDIQGLPFVGRSGQLLQNLQRPVLRTVIDEQELAFRPVADALRGLRNLLVKCPQHRFLVVARHYD